MGLVRRFVLALTFVAATAPAAIAQRVPKLSVAVAAATALTEGPVVTTEGLLGDPKTREHLRNGFPARMLYHLELWRTGTFDDRAGRSDWDVFVNYEPSTQVYNVVRRSSEGRVREDFGGFASVTSAEMQLSRPYKTTLHPTRSGRYYYRLIVEVQTLTESDLDATLQWLRGPTAPGKTSNPLKTIQSGLGTLFSRMLGGGRAVYEWQSEIFTVE